MLTRRLLLLAILIGAPALTFASSAGVGRIAVAVAEPDIETIVIAVGGNEVETFSLFKGCILRENLEVETAVRDRLAKANAIVWTGFLTESAAITESLTTSRSKSIAAGNNPRWIDVSKGATRSNVPGASCYGDVNPRFASGDPFFWLNPNNGATIARNVAEGLGALRPEKRQYFLANARAFRDSLDKDIARWKEQLKPMAKLRVFSAQCGWQNISKLGGPVFAVCKGTPGKLPTPEILVERVHQMKADLIIIDPNTPAEYGQAFREQSVKVIEVASSIANIPGANTYSALFDNFVRSLQRATKN